MNVAWSEELVGIRLLPQTLGQNGYIYSAHQQGCLSIRRWQLVTEVMRKPLHLYRHRVETHNM